MNKYPEHIDQLDNFYQSELANVEVLPPADMWDRISASLEDNNTNKGGASAFTNKQKSIGIGSLIVLLGVTASVYYANHASEPDNKSSIPVISTPSTDDNTSSKKEFADQNINKTSSNTSRSLKTKNTKSTEYTPTENNSTVEDPITEEYQQTQPSEQPSAEVTDIVPAEKQEEPIENAPKKKVSFKDKHKQGYQDSTRNLFVPGK